MAQLQKGTVTGVSADGSKGILRPLGGGDSVTPELPVQRIKIESPDTETGTKEQLHPDIDVGDIVAFVLFDDGTGLIIDKIAD